MMVPIHGQGIVTPQLHLAMPPFGGEMDLDQTDGVNL